MIIDKLVIISELANWYTNNCYIPTPSQILLMVFNDNQHTRLPLLVVTTSVRLVCHQISSLAHDRVIYADDLVEWTRLVSNPGEYARIFCHECTIIDRELPCNTVW